MKIRTLLLASAPLAALAALLAAPSSADLVPSPRPKPAPASSSVPTSVPASASAAEPAPAPGTEKTLEADPPGTEATPAPKLDEWKGAAPVKLARNIDKCRAYRLREWLKVHCDGIPAAGVSMLAGSRDGVQVWVDPPREPDEPREKLRSAQVIFPLRRGDGRLFQIGQFGEGYDGPVAWNLVITISEYWVAGEPAPIVTVR